MRAGSVLTISGTMTATVTSPAHRWAIAAPGLGVYPRRERTTCALSHSAGTSLSRLSSAWSNSGVPVEVLGCRCGAGVGSDRCGIWEAYTIFEPARCVMDATILLQNPTDPADAPSSDALWVDELVEHAAVTQPHHSIVIIAVHDAAAEHSWVVVKNMLISQLVASVALVEARCGTEFTFDHAEQLVEATVEANPQLGRQPGRHALLAAAVACRDLSVRDSCNPSTVCPSAVWLLAQLFSGWVPSPTSARSVAASAV